MTDTETKTNTLAACPPLTAVLAARQLPDGVPCEHRGCLHHISHPCEGCGRIAGITQPKAANVSLEERGTPRPEQKRKPLVEPPEPRYDNIFYEGVKWLNDT